jgi:hypothetical protein
MQRQFVYRTRTSTSPLHICDGALKTTALPQISRGMDAIAASAYGKLMVVYWLGQGI